MRYNRERLTRDEESVLIQKVKTTTGEPRTTARNRLIANYYPMVFKIADRLTTRNVNYFDDLIQIGMVGLMRAAEMYDSDYVSPRTGNHVTFCTYVYTAIWRNMAMFLDKIAKQSPEILFSQYQSEDSKEEYQSDDSFLSGPLERSFVDSKSDPDPSRVEMERILLSHIKKMEARDQDVLFMRYGLQGAMDLSLEEAGKKIGVTKERVRQLQVRALQRLRNSFAETATTY